MPDDDDGTTETQPGLWRRISNSRIDLEIAFHVINIYVSKSAVDQNLHKYQYVIQILCSTFKHCEMLELTIFRSSTKLRFKNIRSHDLRTL